MDGLSFRIDDRVLGRHPEVQVGALRVDRLEVAAAACRDLDALFRAARTTLVDAGIEPAGLTSEPRIAAWRRAIAACGLQPSRHRSSPEQLARRLLRDGVVRTPLPIVGLYCALSARHLAPLGAYDLDRLPTADLALRLGCPETDSFSPLGGGDGGRMPVGEKVVVYAAGDRVICWAFNVRDSGESCLAAGTRRAVFLGEAVAECQQQALRGALADLRDRLGRLGASPGEVQLFDRLRPRGVIARPGGGERE